MKNLFFWCFILVGGLAWGAVAQNNSAMTGEADETRAETAPPLDDEGETTEPQRDPDSELTSEGNNGTASAGDVSISEEKETGSSSVVGEDSLSAGRLEYDPERTRMVRESHDLDAVREEIDRLRDQGRRLERLAGRLEDDAEDLEDQADDLLDRAGGLQDKMELIHVLRDVPDSLMDPEERRLGEVATRLSKKQEVMIERLRVNADALTRKAKAMSVKVRVMEEHADRNEEEADDLEELAEELVELRDTIPFQVVHPIQISFEHRITAVPPVGDEEVHLLTIGGLGFSYYLTPRLRVGLEDLAFVSNGTVYGRRHAVSFAPIVDASVFLIRSIQVSGGVGALMQIQTGEGAESKLAVAPFAAFKSAAWVGKRFSVGPSLRVNYLAEANLYSVALPSDRAHVLPESAFWLDFGVSLNVHL